jgi:hypothetical protein
MGSEGSRAGEYFKNEMDPVVIASFWISAVGLFVLPAVLLGMELEHKSGAVETIRVLEPPL